MGDGRTGTILTTKPAPRNLDIAQSLRWVRATYSIGAARQAFEIAALAYSRQRLGPKDYFLQGLFRREIGPAERASYVSDISSEALNFRLAPRSRFSQHDLLRNKVLTGLLLDRLGLPTPPILALHGAHYAVPGLRQLADPAAIAGFLGDGANLPCFGKPVVASSGVGGAAVLGAEDAGRQLRLGDGRIVATADLATEIARHFPKGYLFQPLIRQHPDIEAYNGPAVGVLRLVTLRGEAGPEPLYGVLRMPPKGAMSDGVIGRPNAHALIDIDSGRALRAQDIARFCTTELTHSLATGKPISDLRLPDLPEAIRVALAAHGALPAHGVLGFDIALGRDGPLINEINTLTSHGIYQRAADRGVLNPDFRPRIEAAIALSRAWADAPGRRRRFGFARQPPA